jgi:adenylate cyclase
MVDGKNAFQRVLLSKSFGLAIGLLVFLAVSWMAFLGTALFRSWDRSLEDALFQLRSSLAPQKTQEGAVVRTQNSKISPDILILGVDNRSLETLGRWPFSRSVHADFLNSLTRIKNQTTRERAVFLDFFFLDKELPPENDLAFIQAVHESQRVFLETIYAEAPLDQDLASVQFDRLKVLLQKTGSFGSISGDWKALVANEQVQAPLIPLAREAGGEGTATFVADEDKVFRRQGLVAKVTQVLQEWELTDLKPDLADYDRLHQRYVYTNSQGFRVTLPSPLTAAVVSSLPDLLAKNGLSRQVQEDGSDQLRTTYFIQKVQDIFLPSMPLALALEYWHKKPSDAMVVLGDSVRVPTPQLFNPDTGTWGPAPFPEVRIPIDSQGNMTVNFQGPRSSEDGSEYQTFPVRSYSSYATKAPPADPAGWPESRQLAGKILMVGSFSSGMADDEKNTPMGQMYGVEMHANALNTILTRNFLVPVPVWIPILTLLAAVLLVSFLSSRASALISLLVTVLLLLFGLVATYFLFDQWSLVYPYTSFFTGVLVTFLLVVVYRALTEEREKRKVRNVFSKYVSPDVVTELLAHPPELGGVDKELTVLFSDIRGFTSLSEGMSPQELVNHLNQYLTAMTDIIHQYKGTLDKYVGDEIMCFWGAPLEQPDHAVLATKCALKMMEVLGEMNAKWAENRQIRIGIGLNSGIMTVGNMGSQGRMNYTLMGDNVNLGARLEGTNKEYLTNIIISENTYHYLGNDAVVRELDNIRVKGKNRPVLIYELLDFTGGFEPPVSPGKKK